MEQCEAGHPQIEQQPRNHPILRRVAQVAFLGLRLGAKGVIHGARIGAPLVGGIAGMDTLQEQWPTTTQIEAGDLEARVVLDLDGHATANVSAGYAWYDATDGPFGMQIRLTNIDEDAAGSIREDLSEAAPIGLNLEEQASEKIDDLLRTAILKMGLGFMIGAGLGGVFAELVRESNTSKRLLGESERNSGVRHELLRLSLASILVPTLSLSTIGVVSHQTMNDFSYDELHYEGLAGSVYDLIQPSIDNFDTYKANSSLLTEWLNNLLVINKNASELPDSTSGLIPILVTGDSHQRPCTYARKALLIDTFQPAFAVDGGDLSEWDQEEEQKLFSTPSCPDDNPSKVGVQEYVIPGNHDGKNALQNLAKYPNVTVFDELETFEVNGDGLSQPWTLRITSSPNPNFTPDSSARQPTQNGEMQVEFHDEKLRVIRQGQDIGTLAKSIRPEIIAAHDPTAVRAARVIIGAEFNYKYFEFHSHKFQVIKDFQNNIIGVNPGSFGGAGLRTLENEASSNSSASEAAIVYINPVTNQIELVLQITIKNDGTVSVTPHRSGAPLRGGEDRDDFSPADHTEPNCHLRLMC